MILTKLGSMLAVDFRPSWSWPRTLYKLSGLAAVTVDAFCDALR